MTRRGVRRFLPLAVALLAASVTAPVHATDRYYNDISVTSPSGRYRLEARSPDNAGERPHQFASDFTYTLTETATNRVIWTRLQPRDERPPNHIFLNDDLWVVINTPGAALVILEPVTARCVGEVQRLDQFTAGGQRSVGERAAGPLSAIRSRWSFLEHDGRMHFVIRKSWDRRVIVDLAAAAVVESPPDALRAACDEDDRAFVLAELADARRRYLEADDRDWNTRLGIYSAVHLAGRMQVREAVPLLRQMEALDVIGRTNTGGPAVEYGEINPDQSSDSTIRQFVQLALRRLREKPSELPCTWFRYTRRDGAGELVEVPELPGPRAARVDLVREGMKPIEVLEAIGAPDWRVDRSWEYDIDDEPAYTLRVHWRDRRVVERLERITPPLWQPGDRRDVRLIR